MRIGIFTFGSRGDVQPYLALAIGLRQAGHDVFFCAPSDFAALVESYDVPFRPMSMSFKELMEQLSRTRAIKNPVKLLARSWREWGELGEQISNDAWRLLQDADAIIFTPLTSTAYGVARKLEVPSVMVYCLPLDPSSELPAVFAGMTRRRGPLLNRLASEVGYRVMWRVFARGARRLRRQLELPRLPFWGPLAEFAKSGQPVIYFFSPTIVPRPSDWRKDIHVVGFGFLDPPGEWQPPADLVRFLDSGPPPVFIGFGSMPHLGPTQFTAMLIHAVERSGRRAILQSGQARLGDGITLPESIMPIGDVPHSWLFPRVSAIMHHGGAGTTAAAFRAGVPQIIVPHTIDQPFWAQVAFEAGVSPKPFSVRKLSVERAVAAIGIATTDSAMRERAQEIAAKIWVEDGVGRAVQLCDAYLAGVRSNSRQPVPQTL